MSEMDQIKEDIIKSCFDIKPILKNLNFSIQKDPNNYFKKARKHRSLHKSSSKPNFHNSLTKKRSKGLSTNVSLPSIPQNLANTQRTERFDQNTPKTHSAKFTLSRSKKSTTHKALFGKMRAFIAKKS